MTGRQGGQRSPAFGPGPGLLLVDGQPVAPVAVARTVRERHRGLLGTRAVHGALWITRCPTVHTVGMRYSIDVAVLDRDGVVLHLTTLRPWRGTTRWRRRADATVEAAANSMRRWGIEVGSRLAVVEPSAPTGSATHPISGQWPAPDG
ncbi:MAG: DUF192 domain-containing protein [Angustibacter sp.]